jgi:hypothetical protein
MVHDWDFDGEIGGGFEDWIEPTKSYWLESLGIIYDDNVDVREGKGSLSDPFSFGQCFNKWRKTQTHQYIAVRVPKGEVDDLKTLIKARKGWTIK